MSKPERQPQLALPADDPGAVQQAKRAQARRKRVAARERRVLSGVDELSRFLQDLIRHGLASASDTGYRSWDEMASRMVDAQAPGLARMVRDLGSVAHAGSGWQDELLLRIGRLHLLLEAYRRVDQLDDDLAADVRGLIGFTTRRDDVLASPAVRDRWWVLGQRLELQDNLSTSRTWLWGETTKRFALVLSFAAGGQAFDVGPPPGSLVEAQLCFYPGTVPLRAVIASSRRGGRRKTLDEPHPFASLCDAWRSWGHAVAKLPWVARFPMALRQVVPSFEDGRWRLQDDRHALPAEPFGNDGWKLLALSGGRPLSVFGEWTGGGFVPLACFGEEGFVVLAHNPLFLGAVR